MANYILQSIIIIILGLLYRYVQKIPETLHKTHIAKIEYDFNKQLESFKGDISNEIEKMKIAETELQLHKIKEFTNLVEFLFTNMLDAEYIAQLEKNTKIQKEFNKKMMDLGTKLFFFASDETVKKYVEWRRFGLETEVKKEDQHKVIILLAELMVLIRKDLGYKDTLCTKDDFLHIMLKDWEKHEGKYSDNLLT